LTVAGRQHDQEILTMAVPALGALVAEPLFLLVDSAIVGHLGRASLAGLGAASAALSTLVSVCVFLAYGTTASVSRMIGAGDPRGALRQGYNGMWLAICLGTALMAAALPLAPGIVHALGATGDAFHAGVVYLRISVVGLPVMLLVLASTGVLRGMHAMRTTLVVAVGGAVVNAVLNVILVYPVGLGIAGSALGTVLTQAGMACVFVIVTVRAGRENHVSALPHWSGIRAAGVASVALLIRTMALRVYLLVGTWVAAGFGTASLAAHGLASNIWNLLALALDALAIAGQGIVGRYLGAGDAAGAKSVTRRMVWMGVLAGVALTALVLGLRQSAPPLFTGDAEVRRLLASVLLLVAAFQPVGGVVFVLDGVLIGAGDGRFLAILGIVTTGVFLAAATVVVRTHAGLTGLWWAVGVFMLARLVGLGARAAGSSWLVLGARR
jgi:MATE family, multidrug efflux pump